MGIYSNKFHEKPNKLDYIIGIGKIETGIPVYLKIYHLNYVNYVIQFLGIGLYHTTIQVENLEFSYQKCSGDGIYSINAGEENLNLKEKIFLGYSLYTLKQIKYLLSFHNNYWTGKSYDPFKKNCNHFTKYAAKLILDDEILCDYPDYVNKITDYGLFLNIFYIPYERIYGKPLVFNENSTAIDSNLSINQENNNSEIINSNQNEININDIPVRLTVVSNSLLNEDNRDTFFDNVFNSNFFIKNINYLGNNDFMKLMLKGDHLMIKEKKYSEALNIYQELLHNIDKEQKVYLEFNTCFTIENQRYKLFLNENNKNDLNILIKIKIFHCLNYIFYKFHILKDQETSAYTILKLNKKDYFAYFELAYVKFQQKLYHECQTILNEGKKCCGNINIHYKNNFTKFLEFIENADDDN